MFNETHLRRLTAMLIAAIAMAVAVAACGGDDGEDADPTQPPAADVTSQASPASDETPAGESDTVTVDEAFWHAGWKVTVGEAAYDPAEGAVTIDVEFENLGDETGTFNSQVVLQAGGDNYEADDFAEPWPQVPAGLSADGVFAFNVEDGFAFDDAALLIGNPTNNQAYVPIGPDAPGELVSLEPQQIAANGTIVAGGVTVTVTGAELRADLPDRSTITEKGKLALTVFFDVTVGQGIPIGQGVFQDPNVALTQPDGTSVAVISDGVSGVNELLQGKEGTTISDLDVRFEVDAPPEGEYTFIVRGNFAPGGEVSGELTFTIPPGTWVSLEETD